MYIRRLELKNYTSFDSLQLDFSPNINIISGENNIYFLQQEFSLYSEYKATREKLDIKFISLYKQDGNITAESGSTLAELEHNTIMQEMNYITRNRSFSMQIKEGSLLFDFNDDVTAIKFDEQAFFMTVFWEQTRINKGNQFCMRGNNEN